MATLAEPGAMVGGRAVIVAAARALAVSLLAVASLVVASPSVARDTGRAVSASARPVPAAYWSSLAVVKVPAPAPVVCGWVRRGVPAVMVGASSAVVSLHPPPPPGLVAVGLRPTIAVGVVERSGRLVDWPGRPISLAGGAAAMRMAAMPGLMVGMSRPLGLVPFPSARPLGAESSIAMPASWAGVALPDRYIGYSLAALAIARGAVVDCRLGVHTLVDGRQVITSDGRSRVFHSWDMFARWHGQIMDDLAGAVGGLAVREIDPAARAAWVMGARGEVFDGRAGDMLRAAGKMQETARGEALFADACFLLTRI